LEEIVYDDAMTAKAVLGAETSLGVPVVPVVIFDVDATDGGGAYVDEWKDTEMLTTKLNEMMEDASDSLAFEMFRITVISNAKEGTAKDMQIAPGAVVEIQSNHEGIRSDMKTLENSFKWKEAYKDQYNRIKSAL